MARTTSRRLTAGVLGAGFSLLAAPTAARAGAGDTSVAVDRLVLEPGDGGYVGILPVTVTYLGTSTAYLNLTVTEPVPGAFVGLTPEDTCMVGAEKPLRDISCIVPGGPLQTGERRRFSVNFRVLTAARPHPMITRGGRLTLSTGDANPANHSTSFDTLFRGDNGSLRNPRPYVWDTNTEASLTVGAAALHRQPGGGWLGRLPVTVRSAGDAAHDAYHLEPALPPGVELVGVEPASWLGSSCAVPGGRFMQGEERTVSLPLRASADAPPGSLGSGSLRLHAVFGWHGEVADIDPSGNTTTFAVTTVD